MLSLADDVGIEDAVDMVKVGTRETRLEGELDDELDDEVTLVIMDEDDWWLEETGLVE